VSGVSLSSWIEAICGPGALAVVGPALLPALMLAGLVGGAVHCAGMCGPFVLAQATSRSPRDTGSALSRLSGSVLLPYHLGRATTYALLGGIGAGMAGTLIELSGFRWIAAVLLCVAALLMLAHAFKGFGVSFGGFAPVGMIGRIARPLFANPRGLRGYGLGVTLGFMPCGLLYAALVAAAATGSLWGGALAMAAFSIGTAPALIAVALTGRYAARRWPAALSKVSTGLMAASAIAVAAMAVHWVA